MKKILFVITILSMVISITACNAKCEKCDKISELKVEADELKEFLDNYDLAYEGSSEQLNAEEKLKSIESQLITLTQHECTLPAEKVENMEYSLGSYTGLYTGELKSGVAHGEGAFVGTDSNNIAVKYKGNFTGGKLDGYGEFLNVSADGNTWIYYKGEFSENHYQGNGYYCRAYTGQISEMDGELSKDKFVNGEYQTSDRNGNITDYGIYEDGKITYTALGEEIKRQNIEVKNEAEKRVGEFYKGMFDMAVEEWKEIDEWEKQLRS